MSKNRTIIYGLGKRFTNRYFQDVLLPEINKVYDVIGICDREIKETQLDDKLTFIERTEKLLEYDLIIITSDVYYNEIKCELMQDFNIESEKIISLDAVEDELINDSVRFGIFDKLSGVEIGGPSGIFRNIYKICDKCDGVNFSNETVWWGNDGTGYKYKNNLLGNVIIADAVDLSVIADKQYDFCISSNNLEHIANPLKALVEFKRIVKCDGYLLIIVPCKDMCFDHNREYVTFEHILSDYKNGIDEYDLSHLDEIIKMHDYSMDDGIDSKSAFLERAKDNYNNRCLHQHVFNELVLKQMYEYLKIDVIDSGKILNNYYIIGKRPKNKL